MAQPSAIRVPRALLRAVAVVALSMAMSGVAASVGVSNAAPRHPAKGNTTSSVTKGDGQLHVFSFNGRRFGVTTAIHVLTFRGSRYKLQIGLARHGVDSGLQTTSSMCRRIVRCVAAVNGDFFDTTGRGESVPGDEVGAIVKNCVLIHSPEIAQQQVNLDGHSVAKSLTWATSIYVGGSGVAIAAINQDRPIAYAKVQLPLTGTLLYTAPYGALTPTSPSRVTYEFTQIDRSISPTAINSTAELRFAGRTVRAIKVGTHEVDVSAPRGSRLGTLRVGDTVIMTTVSSSGCDSIGGHPVLLDHGIVTPLDGADTYLTRPFARSVVGWTSSGTTVIMVVDGQDGVTGATANQLVRLLEAVHVVTALDLDGGNSASLYARGRILNHPSQSSERPVSTALLVVRVR